MAQRTFRPADLSVVEVGAIIQTQLYWGQGVGGDRGRGGGGEGVTQAHPQFFMPA